MTFRVVLGVLFATIVFSCQPASLIADFYSSRALFSLPSNQSDSLSFSYQTYNITLPRKYDRSASPQYAFALGEAAAVTGNLTYFDLLVLKTFQASLIVNFIYEPRKWTVAAFNYWVSFRNDVVLGVESFASTQISKKNGGYQIGCMLRQSVPNQVAALVFLSGIRFDASNGTQGHRLSFVINRQYVQNDKLVFGFTCNTTIPLASITFAYVVFDPHALPFASYGGTVSSTGLASTAFKDLRYIVAAGTAYSLFGISSIEAANAFTFTSALLSNLTLAYGVNQWERLALAELTYVIIGQSPASVCLQNSQCQASGQVLISAQECVSACPPTSRPVTHMDGAVECLPCPPNAIYSNSTNKCICPEGYSLQSDASCLPQPQTASVSYNRAIAGDQLGSASSPSADCLKVVGARANNKNLFITIQAGKQVLSDQQNSAKDYITLKFGSNEATSYYCGLSSQEKTQFSCLALFPLGVPTAITITASCTLSSSNNRCSSTFNYQTTKPQ